jgi:hypothetical protein
LLALLGALAGPAQAAEGKAEAAKKPQAERKAEAEKGTKASAAPGKINMDGADAAAKKPCAEGTQRVDVVTKDARGNPWTRELSCEDKKGQRQGHYERYWLDEHGTKAADGHHKDGKPVGFWQEHWDNGFKAMEGNYDDSGRKTGKWTYWHSNGIKSAEGKYLNDLKDGRWEASDSYGEVTHRAEYVKGKLRHGQEVVERGEPVDDPGLGREGEEEEEEEEERRLSPRELRERRARELREREMRGEGPGRPPRAPWDMASREPPARKAPAAGGRR